MLIADVSDFQRPVDPAAYKSVGIDGVITKVTESNGFATRTHPHNLAAARDAGMIAGGYHFLHRGDPNQADWYLDHVEAAWGGHNGLLHMLDVEQEACGKNPTIDDVRTFVQRFHTRTGNHPLLIYSGTWYWKGILGNPQDTCGAGLVDARYVRGCGDPRDIVKTVTAGYWVPYGGWKQPLLRQFTSSARVPGEPFPVDVSVAYGSDDQVRGYLRHAAPPAPWTTLPTLRKGDGVPPAPPNQAVTLLQGDLDILHARPTVTIDGRFGDGTELAVRQFQQFLHTKDPTITVDGVVGQQTWRGLYFFAKLAQAQATSPTRSTPSSTPTPPSPPR